MALSKETPVHPVPSIFYAVLCCLLPPRMTSTNRTRKIRTLVLSAIAITICLAIITLTNARQNAVLFAESDETQVKLDLEATDQKQTSSPKQDLTNDPGQPFDPAKEYKEILSFSPVVVFSKSYCPHCKFVKNLLSKEYQITPPPAYVELDKHPHGSDLQDFIAEKSGRKTVPNVFIAGVTRGGGDEIKQLHEDGQLGVMFQRWGGNNLRVKRLSAPSVS